LENSPINPVHEVLAPNPSSYLSISITFRDFSFNGQELYSLTDSKHQIPAKKAQKESLWKESTCFAQSVYSTQLLNIFFF